MSGKYIWAALIIAGATHLALVHAIPHLNARLAIERLLESAEANAWTQSERVTHTTRTITRPVPNLAEAVCIYDLAHGPVIVAAPPWDAYWSLTFYAADGHAFFALDDREARYGAEITLVRAGRNHPEGASQVVESPTQRGIAIIRRLAPTASSFAAAQALALEDVCTSVETLRS